MLFRKRVSLQSASNARRRARHEVATHSLLAWDRTQRTMHSTSPRPPQSTSPAPECRWKRGRPVAPPARTFGTLYPSSRSGVLQDRQARRPNNTEINGTLSRSITSASRLSQAGCTSPACNTAGIMPCSHHATAAHAFDSSATDTNTTTTIKEPSQHRDPTSVENLPSSPSVQSSGVAAMSETNNVMEKPTGSESVVDQEYKEETGEEVAAEQEEDPPEEHIPLSFQISESKLRAAMLARPNTRASFWSQDLYRGPNNEKLAVHYCRTPEVADRVAQYFLSEKIVGFDIEWKPRASPLSIKKNASLIQLACENRIALFHVSLFPGTTPEELMPKNLKAVLESPDVVKVGVAIKGDFSRLAKYLEIQPQGVFELSRLRNLVEFYATDPTKVSNRLVNLAAQVLQHLQLPLYKGGQLLDEDAADVSNVRESDWSQRLNLQQINYAAADAYAGFRLYDVLERKRKQLIPTPPRPHLCDYDSRPLPKSKDTRKKPKIDKQSKDRIDADTTSAISPTPIQRPEAEQASEEDGYETAQEDLIDSHQLEDPVPASPTSSASNDDSGEVSCKQIGRINLSLLRGPDPGYPVLPEISDDDQIESDDGRVETPQTDDLEASPSNTPEESTDSDNVTSEAPDEILKTEEDEFEDPELEKAFQDLEIDSDGTLKNMTSTPTSAPDPPQEDTSPHPVPPETTSPSAAVHTPEYNLATTWAQDYLVSSIPQPGSSVPPRIRATVPHLRAYHLWYHQGLSLKDIASHLRDPPLSLSTVSGYLLQAISLEGMQYDERALKEVVAGLPDGLKRGRWKKFADMVGVLG